MTVAQFYSLEEEWLLYDKTDFVDKKLLFIKIPHECKETPKSIKDRFRWKVNTNFFQHKNITNINAAAEFCYFALYLSIYIVYIFFTGEKSKYTTYWMCLIKAIHLLSGHDIREESIAQAEIMLKIFVLQVGSLYEKEF